MNNGQDKVSGTMNPGNLLLCYCIARRNLLHFIFVQGLHQVRFSYFISIPSVSSDWKIRCAKLWQAFLSFRRLYGALQASHGFKRYYKALAGFITAYKAATAL